MATKIVLLFNATTVGAPANASLGYAGSPHTPGWTESFWLNSALTNAEKTNLQQYVVPKRAALLPVQARVQGVKLYIGGGGRGVALPFTAIGSAGDADQLQIALLCQSNSVTAPRQRKFWIHAVPDAQVTEGEFRPVNGYAAAVRDYLSELAAYSFPSVQKSLQQSIFNIAADGTVTLFNNQPYAANQIVTLQNVSTSFGRKSAQLMIASIGPALTQFKVSGWTFGSGQGGSVFLGGTTFYRIGDSTNPPTVIRSGTRKIGRPFGAYNGRRSKRKRSA